MHLTYLFIGRRFFSQIVVPQKTIGLTCFGLKKKHGHQFRQILPEFYPEVSAGAPL